jgi:cytochrome c biogenesis protein CcmG/thiol:disulfide interchange protein DsbE
VTRAIPLLVFFVVMVFLAIGLTLDPREVPSPLIGKPAPALRLPEVGDAARTLDIAELKGQVFVLNVWASWCPSCRQEHPVLLDLAKRNRVPLYGLDYKDERSAALAWLAFHGGDPYTASGFDADGKTGLDWGVYGVPETFVIDKRGVIRHKFTGPLTAAQVETELLPLVRSLQAEAAP